MRLILILWMIPIVVFWGWYGLSANDITMGSVFLSRAFHDYMFKLYGSMLGVPPQDVPALIAGVFAFDTMLLLIVAALRWHKKWFPQTKTWVLETLGMATTDHELVEHRDSGVEQFLPVEPTAQTNEQERSTYPMHPAE